MQEFPTHEDEVSAIAGFAVVLSLALVVVLGVLHHVTRGRSSPLAVLGFALGGPALGMFIFVIAVLGKPEGATANSFRVCRLAPDDFMLVMMTVGLITATVFASIYTAQIKDELRADSIEFHNARPRPVASSALYALGLDAFATIEEVEQAYRERAKKVHPDHGGDDEAFKRLQAHYDRAKRQVRRRDA